MRHETDATLPGGFVADLEAETLANRMYRFVRFTTATMQLVYMYLVRGATIPYETHINGTQLIRVEKGTIRIRTVVGGVRREATVAAGGCFIVPPGVQHEVEQLGHEPVCLYTVYGGPQHSPVAEHKKQRDAAADEHLDEQYLRVFQLLRTVKCGKQTVWEQIEALAGAVLYPGDSAILRMVAEELLPTRCPAPLRSREHEVVRFLAADVGLRCLTPAAV